jgi:hypothetical protein
MKVVANNYLTSYKQLNFSQMVQSLEFDNIVVLNNHYNEESFDKFNDNNLNHFEL